MAINFKANTKDFAIALGKMGNKLQIAGASTVNEVTTEMREDYNKRLQKNTEVRTKFTTNASRTFKSNPISKSGKPRQLSRINSKLVVRKMKGGKEHYLSKLENGTTQQGNKLTMGKVPVPLNAGRTKGNYNRAISAPNRLLKGKTQTLRTGGSRKIGIPNDGYSTAKQRWAVLYSSFRSGNLIGDLKKPFFMIDNKDKLGIFKFKGKRVKKIRKLEESSKKFKPEPHFENTVNAVKKSDVENKFIKNAKKTLIGK